jgi:phage gp37-like protein
MSFTSIPLPNNVVATMKDLVKTFVVVHKREEGAHVDMVINGLEREQAQLESNLRLWSPAELLQQQSLR